MSEANDKAVPSPPPDDAAAPPKRSRPAIAAADFVSRLVSDPANPPQTTLLTGYPGASDEENHTRIYFDPELRDYVDVPDDDVLHTQPGGGEGPVEPTLIWIRQDSQVLHGQAAGDRQRAGFFEGRVWQDNFAATAEAGAGAAAGAITAGLACRPSAFIACRPSVVAICRTMPAICRVVSARIRCPVASPWCGPLPWTQIDPNITETLGNPTIVQRPGFGAFQGGDWGTDTIHQGAADWTSTTAQIGAVRPSIASPCGPSAFIACRPSIVAVCRTAPVICRHIPSVHIRCPVASPWCGPLPWTRVDPNITETLGNPTIVQQPGFGAFQGGDWGTDTIHQGSGDWTDTINFGDAGGGFDAAATVSPECFVDHPRPQLGTARPQCFVGGVPPQLPPTLNPRICVTLNPVRCPIATGHNCPSFGFCPSRAGCPSVGFCPTDRFDPTIFQNQTRFQHPGFGAFQGGDWGTDTIHQGSGDWTDTVNFGDAGGGFGGAGVGLGGAAVVPSIAAPCGQSAFVVCQSTPFCPIITRGAQCLITYDARCFITHDARCFITSDPRRCPVASGHVGACRTDRFDPTIFQNPTVVQNQTVVRNQTIVQNQTGFQRQAFGAAEDGSSAWCYPCSLYEGQPLRTQAPAC
jgi:hypothetical protein